MPKAVIPSGELEYIDLGRGAPLVLLHGGTGSIEEWDACIDRFSTTYRVVAYNRRGYGGSSPREVFASDFFAEDVEDLVSFLDILGLSGPVFLCAFSDGGTIALMLASRFPTRVRAMVCVGAHIYVEEKSLEGLARALEVFENRVVKMGMKETPQVRSQRAWFDRWLHKDAEFLHLGHELSSIECPTLVVQGTEDEYAEMIHAERIAQGIQGAELWFVEGARHWVHRGEHAEAFMDRVEAFLSESTRNR